MTDFRERYKRVGFGREDMDVNRVLRSQRRDEARREMRSEHFSLKRDMELADQDDSLNECNKQGPEAHHEEDSKSKADAELERMNQERLLQLQKWREERNRRRIREKKRAKPVFKVGVVHHRVYSPPITKDPVPPPPPKLCRTKEAHQQPEPPKRVTRATEKRLAAKTVANQQKRENKRLKKNDKVQTNNKRQSENIPFAPVDHQFKAPAGITAIPIFGRKALEAAKNDVQFEMNSTNASSTSEFPNSLNTNSLESVFSSTSNSSLLSKLSSRRSVLTSCNTQHDSSINKSLNNSMNNSSVVESVVLKMSLDDQEMLEEQENVDTNCKMDFSFTKSTKSPKSRRRSSRIFSPLTVAPLQNEEMIVDEPDFKSNEKENSLKMDFSLFNQNKTKRRSSRNLAPSIEPISATEKTNVVQEDQDTIVDQEEAVQTNSFSNQNKVKSTTSRRSSKTVASKEINKVESPANKGSIKSIDETINTRKLKKKDSFHIQDQEMLNDEDEAVSHPKETNERDSSMIKKTKLPGMRKSMRNIANLNDSQDEVSVTEEVKATAPENQVKNTSAADCSFSKKNRRKSIRVNTDKNVSIEEPMQEVSYTIENQGATAFNNKNLIDSTFFYEPSKIESPAKRKFNPDLQESLIKFSPRQSIRLQRAENSRKQISFSEVNTSTINPENTVNQPLIKFSPLNQNNPARTESFNASSSSEPTKRKTSENDDDNSQNFSLNMSLPKDETPDKPPAFFSPYIVTSRGKSSVRKEVQRRRFSQSSPEEIPTKNTIMQSLNISIEEEQRTSQYYKFILDKEIERLNERCDTWNVIKEDDATPEDFRYTIQAAVGQTHLLINKKFERFRGLVLDCETGNGEMLVTCKDLQGFWDMMYMEIRDCDTRFNKLEELKANGWPTDEVDEQDVQKQQPKKKKAPIKKPVVKKKTASAKSSSLRALIMAARKKMESTESDPSIEKKEPSVSKQNSKMQEVEEQLKKGNNSIHEKSSTKSSRRTSTPISSNKWPLIKNVLLSRTPKLTTSPLIVMKLSQMCKTPEVQLDDSIIYINSDRTPARGILKVSKDESIVNSVIKSTNKVFFKEQPMEVQEFDVDTHDEDDTSSISSETKAPIERRLDFEGDSFNASNVEDEEKKKEISIKSGSPVVLLSPVKVTPNKQLTMSKIIVHEVSPLLSMSPLSLTDTKTENSISKKNGTKLKKQISFKEDTNENSTRILKNKKFSAPLTPIRPRLREADADDCSREANDSMDENNDGAPFTIPEQTQIKELYLNANGMVCEKTVPLKKDTPRSTKLKRSHSEALRKSITDRKIQKTDDEMPGTPRLRRRNTHVPEIRLDSPNSSVNVIATLRKSVLSNEVQEKDAESKTPGTPRSRQRNAHIPEIKLDSPASSANSDANRNIKSSNSRSTKRSLKRPMVDPISIEDDINENDKDLNESVTTPKLRRTNSKSLRSVDRHAHDNAATLKSRKTISTLANNEENSKGKNSKEAIIPSVKRSNSKELQKNIPNEQKTDPNMNKTAKISRTSSLKRKNSMKYLDNVKSSEQKTEVSKKISEALTPNTRRKSLRIAQTSTRTED